MWLDPTAASTTASIWLAMPYTRGTWTQGKDVEYKITTSGPLSTWWCHPGQQKFWKRKVAKKFLGNGWRASSLIWCLDPYLECVRDKLEGIVIFSEEIPVHGSVLGVENALPAKLMEKKLAASPAYKNLYWLMRRQNYSSRLAVVNYIMTPLHKKLNSFLWENGVNDLPAQCAHVSTPPTNTQEKWRQNTEEVQKYSSP